MSGRGAALLERARAAATWAMGSPLAEADLRSLLSSWRVGFWIATLVVLAGLASLWNGALFFSGERMHSAFVAQCGVGTLLVASVQCATASFLTFAIPIRLLGVIDGPRWRGYFDQVVATGVSPARYLAGRAVATQWFLALAFIATAPLGVAFALIDPPPVGQVVEGYAHLLVYGELLLVVSLGLSVLVHEGVAALITVALGLTLGIVAVTPMPSTIAALSPVRGLLAPLLLSLPDQDVAQLEPFYGPPRPFGILLPHLPYSIALSALVGGFALVPCVFGPLHAFVPGFNSLGPVVLPGDRGRAPIRRIRPVLTRRTELAVFFENKGPELARLAPWARVLATGGFLLFVGLLAAATMTEASVVTSIAGSVLSESDAVAIGCVVAFPVAVLAPFVLATGRNEARLPLRVGRFSIPVALADVLVYVTAAWALLALVQGAFERIASPGFLAATVSRVGPQAQAAGVEATAIGLTIGLTLVLIQKVIGLRTYGRLPGAILAVAFVGTTSLLLAGVNPRDIADEEEIVFFPGSKPVRLSPEGRAQRLAGLHVAFPFRLTLLARADRISWSRLPPYGTWRWLAEHGFWVVYPGMDLLLLVTVVRFTGRRSREALAEHAALVRSVEPSGRSELTGAATGGSA